MDNEAIEKLIDNEKEWRRHLVKEIQVVKTVQTNQGQAIATLKVKSGIWGIIGGSIPASAIIIIAYLKSITFGGK
jgi:hypothetical protein